MKINSTAWLLTLAVSPLPICQAQQDWPLPIRAYHTPSGSMENTLQVNDRLIVDAHVYESRAPRNGEIAIFQVPDAAPFNANERGKGVVFIKRVVGVPRDVVTIVDRQLYRNGAKIAEPYCRWDDTPIAPNFPAIRYSYDMKIVGAAVYSRDRLSSDAMGPWKRNGLEARDQDAITRAKPGAVPASSFLVLGDHRSNSNDSHIFGFIPRRAFEGRALFIYWPLSHWKFLPL